MEKDDVRYEMTWVGPYGTNLGDIWTGEGSPVQEMLDRKKPGFVIVHEMMIKDGELQECMYVTDDKDLIEKANAGTNRYLAAQAEKN